MDGFFILFNGLVVKPGNLFGKQKAVKCERVIRSLASHTKIRGIKPPGWVI